MKLQYSIKTRIRLMCISSIIKCALFVYKLKSSFTFSSTIGLLYDLLE